MRIVEKALHAVIAAPLVLLVVLTTAATIVGCSLLYAAVRGYDLLDACVKRLLPRGERTTQRRPARASLPSRHDRR
jgi:hypothetical protein